MGKKSKFVKLIPTSTHLRFFSKWVKQVLEKPIEQNNANRFVTQRELPRNNANISRNNANIIIEYCILKRKRFRYGMRHLLPKSIVFGGYNRMMPFQTYRHLPQPCAIIIQQINFEILSHKLEFINTKD